MRCIQLVSRDCFRIYQKINDQSMKRFSNSSIPIQPNYFCEFFISRSSPETSFAMMQSFAVIFLLLYSNIELSIFTSE